MAADTAVKKKKDLLWFHIIMILLLTFGFGQLEPIGSLTPLGMKLVGVFLGVLWGWSTCGVLWPSLLAMVAVSLTGMITFKDFLTISFGNETMVFMIFIFIFTGVIDEVGLIDYIANKFISFKILNNRPWVFSGLLLTAAYISAAFINMIATIMFFWGIIYVVAERFEFKPYDKYPTLMMIGIVLVSSVGGCAMPYKAVALVLLTAYTTMSGVPLDFFKYICFSLPVTFSVVIFYILICKFIFRPDLKDLKNINADFADKSKLTLNKIQKTAIVYLAMFIFLMVAPNVLPETWVLTQVINQLGMVGCILTLIISMFWVRFDGKPMIDFSKMASKHIIWDIYMIMAFAIPFAGLFTSDATGIKPFMVEITQPILGGLSPVLFMILALTIATVLTNFANNMVVGTVFVTLIYTLGSKMGLDTMPIVAALVVCINLAIATPAASPFAAMLFANTEWLKTSDLYKYCFAMVAIILILIMIFGITWAKIIY
ncbi:MAG: SLC13 family permease [Peptococcaceae bacterium]